MSKFRNTLLNGQQTKKPAPLSAQPAGEAAQKLVRWHFLGLAFDAVPEIVEPGKSLRVLVVEDDAIVALDLSDMLEAMGHEVCASESTEANAVTAAARWKPDVMIVDAHLRHGSGVSAVTEILRSGYIPHVIVSGDTRGIQAVLPDAVVVEKPYTEHDLLRAFVQCLGGGLGYAEVENGAALSRTRLCIVDRDEA